VCGKCEPGATPPTTLQLQAKIPPDLNRSHIWALTNIRREIYSNSDQPRRTGGCLRYASPTYVRAVVHTPTHTPTLRYHISLASPLITHISLHPSHRSRLAPSPAHESPLLAQVSPTTPDYLWHTRLHHTPPPHTATLFATSPLPRLAAAALAQASPRRRL